jgi:Prokaryotic lipoprotein-attachment site
MTGMNRTHALTLIACALLAACGNKGDLQRLASAAPPVIPTGSDAPETPAMQTAPTAEARPARSDELLRRSEERPTDEFDLPPQ